MWRLLCYLFVLEAMNSRCARVTAGLLPMEEGDPNVGSSPSSPASKKRRRRSEVWDEMRKYGDADGNVKAECNHCKKTFDGSSKKGTTHLRNHLERCPTNPKRKNGPGGRDGDDQDQSLSPSIKTKELASLIKENSIIDLIKHFFSTERSASDEESEDWEDLKSRKDEILEVLNSRKEEILQLYQEEKENTGQMLNNLSCRFTLRFFHVDVDDVRACFLVVYYIDDCWERQSKIIRFWHDPLDDVEDFTEAVKQSCLDWKIDSKICSVLLSSRAKDNQIRKMESWFSRRASLPFAGCLRHHRDLMDYIEGILDSEDYIGDGIQSLRKCADYVYKKSTSDQLIQLDGAVAGGILYLKDHASVSWVFYRYGEAVADFKKVCLVLEQFDSDFRSINLSKQKWDEVTATFDHFKFLKDVKFNLWWRNCRIPRIVDLPYVHKILKDRCNYPVEDCLFCQTVMKDAIDRFFSKWYLVGVIAVILDPRFKMDGVQLHYKDIYGSDADRYLEKVNKDFRDVYNEYAATYSTNSKSYEMLDAMGRPCTSSSPKSELDRYFNLLKVPRDKQFDMLAWWRGNAPSFPTLARMARDYLAIQLPFFILDPVGYDFDAMGDDIHDIFYIFDELPSDTIAQLLHLKVLLRDAKN